jgi:hypothetical protein
MKFDNNNKKCKEYELKREERKAKNWASQTSRIKEPLFQDNIISHKNQVVHEMLIS